MPLVKYLSFEKIQKGNTNNIERLELTYSRESFTFSCSIRGIIAETGATGATPCRFKIPYESIG
jgi:hypothetical protein